MEIVKVIWSYEGRLSKSSYPPTGVVYLRLAPEVVVSAPFWSRHSEVKTPIGYYNLGAVPNHKEISIQITMAHAQMLHSKLNDFKKSHYRKARLNKVINSNNKELSNNVWNRPLERGPIGYEMLEMDYTVA